MVVIKGKCLKDPQNHIEKKSNSGCKYGFSRLDYQKRINSDFTHFFVPSNIICCANCSFWEEMKK